MKKLSVSAIVLATLAVLAGIGFGITKTSPPQASIQPTLPESTRTENVTEVSPPARTLIDENNPNTQVTSGTDNLALSLSDDAQAALVKTDEAIVQEVNMFVRQWESSALAVPGWYHLITRHNRENKDPGLFPNSQPIPSDYILDGWYKVREDGLSDVGVILMRDLEENVIQESIYQNGVMRNLTFGVEHPTEPEAIHLDFGFTRQLTRAMENKYQLVQTEATVKGQRVTSITIENETAPSTLAGYEHPVTGNGSSAYFDPASGEILRIERYVISSGEKYIIEISEILLLEKSEEVPLEIHNYLTR